MGEILPGIHRSKLPEEIGYPLRYQDLAGFFAGRTDDDIYLYAWFHGLAQPHAARVRYGVFEAEFRGAGGHGNLLAGQFPDRDHSHIVVVEVHVGALPRQAMVEANLRRPVLRAFVAEQIDRLAQGGLFANRWELRVDLLPDTCQVEAVRKQWTGLREEPEVRSVLALEQPQDQSAPPSRR